MAFTAILLNYRFKHQLLINTRKLKYSYICWQHTYIFILMYVFFVRPKSSVICICNKLANAVCKNLIPICVTAAPLIQQQILSLNILNPKDPNVFLFVVENS